MIWAELKGGKTYQAKPRKDGPLESVCQLREIAGISREMAGGGVGAKPTNYFAPKCVQEVAMILDLRCKCGG